MEDHNTSENHNTNVNNVNNANGGGDGSYTSNRSNDPTLTTAAAGDSETRSSQDIDNGSEEDYKFEPQKKKKEHLQDDLKRKKSMMVSKRKGSGGSGGGRLGGAGGGGGGQDESSMYSDDDEYSSSHQTSSRFGGDEHNVDQNTEISIAKRENQAVMIWKIVVTSVLVLITVGLSITAFVYVDSKEQSAFASNFEEDAIKIFADVGLAVAHRFAQLDALALATASFANATDAIWPMATLPDYSVRYAKARSATGAVALTQYQLVADEATAPRVREEWQDYAASNGAMWVQEALRTQSSDDTYDGQVINVTIQDYVASMTLANEGTNYGGRVVPDGTGPYSPSWQSYPLTPNPIEGGTVFNWNAVQNSLLGPGMQQVLTDKQAVMSQVLNLPGTNTNQDDIKDINAWASQLIPTDADATEPLVKFLYPILNTAAAYNLVQTQDFATSRAVAVLSGTYYWSTLLSDILPSGQYGLVVVIANDCGQVFTYQINGADAVYMGAEDLHDTVFDDYAMSVNLTDLGTQFEGEDFVYTGLPLDNNGGSCLYDITVYPSTSMEEKYRSSDPIIFTYSVIIIFVFTALCFMGYDKLVAERQKKVLKSAQQSNAIISSLFPSNVRDRLYAGDGNDAALVSFTPTKTRLKNYLQDDNQDGKGGAGSKPIADLFTDCTVLFADIANFTAWSSVREPGQVFTLLETLYGAYDQIAVKRGVFKVETIGDSYVAVVGLPEPRQDHALVMAKFARDCRTSCTELCGALEETLGPDTGDLRMRFGMHSGPVTAGVLRGQKSRFQLFGDTVNTAARMESTGSIGKIQVTQATADLLLASKKGHWLQARDEMVEAKGKGMMQTYWVEPINAALGRQVTKSEEPSAGLDSKTERLVSWNVVVLSRMLTQIVAHRIAHKRNTRVSAHKVKWSMPENAMVLNEVKEVIELPDFSAACNKEEDPHNMTLSVVVRNQLREYVTAIAFMYHDNPFHSFEHASHVCMSVAKLLSRIVAPDEVQSKTAGGDGRILASAMHDHTYGITSDPLTQFACVFAALIHDVDHVGVSNATLVEEGVEIAKIYEGKSVAEQNSVNLAWKVLLDNKYKELRDTICATQQEESRFRELVVNTVMATDIMDKDLKKLREARWAKAFAEVPSSPCKDIDEWANDSDSDDDGFAAYEARVALNRKATIVIEHLIQASDVAHTMQHWHIYRKWNERLFMEMHKAFKEGRTKTDPATFWYKGEIGFFDFYIIPLAKKLSDCGVFGVSSDEYLNYAMQNRNEWEKKGQYVVQAMIDKMDDTGE